jgi:hypothetical protein
LDRKYKRQKYFLALCSKHLFYWGFLAIPASMLRKQETLWTVELEETLTPYQEPGLYKETKVITIYKQTRHFCALDV